jgi:hypothetical protein
MDGKLIYRLVLGWVFTCFFLVFGIGLQREFTMVLLIRFDLRGFAFSVMQVGRKLVMDSGNALGGAFGTA